MIVFARRHQPRADPLATKRTTRTSSANVVRAGVQIPLGPWNEPWSDSDAVSEPAERDLKETTMEESERLRYSSERTWGVKQ